MISLFIIGGVLIILQLIWAAYVEYARYTKNWLKYVPSWLILVTGVMFLPLSNFLGGWSGMNIAGAGIIMIVISLITIPLITITLDEFLLKRNSFLREK